MNELMVKTNGAKSLIVYGYILLLIVLPAAVGALFFMGGYFLLGGLLVIGNYIPIFYLVRGFLKAWKEGF